MSPNLSSRRALTRIELLVVLGILGAVAGIAAPFVARVREASGRASSTCRLKAMGIALNGMTYNSGGLLPPSVGTFPADGPNASLFFHLLPYIECNSIYSRYKDDYDAIEKDMVTRPTFCAPLDRTNPGEQTTLTSYASNAAVLGLHNGGSTRAPDDFNQRGTSNVVIFIERFAVVGPGRTRHTWNGRGELENYLYPPHDGSPDPPETIVPQFGVAPADASNETAHAFTPSSLQVGLADGSARTVTRDVTRTFAYADGREATVWAWACSLYGPLAKADVPDGW